MADEAAEAIGSDAAFGEPERWRFEWERPYTKGEWLDQVPTGGVYTSLPADVLGELLEGAGAVIDAVGGAFNVRYTTVVAAERA